MRCIISGGRDFKNYGLLASVCDRLFKNNKPECIVSGCQVTHNKETGELYGADFLGEQYAIAHNISVVRFAPDWKKYNKAAGPIRNKEMAKYATHLIAFWDGKSRGTKNMIDLATEFKLSTRIIRY